MCHPVYSLMVLILKDVNQDVHYKWTSSAGTSFDKSALKAGVCVGTKSPVTAPRYHQFLENCKRNCQGERCWPKHIFMIKRKRPARHNGWGDLHQEQAEVAKAGHLPVIIDPTHCNVFLGGDWVFYFDTLNIHNMFQLTPWSHGIWFSTDKNIQRSQETGPNFHFLSEKLIESESREEVSFKTSSPQGSL